MDTNIKVASHTIVRNGMPFIGKVIENVLPYMNRCLVTISKSSTDETPAIILELASKYPNKVIIDWENVKSHEFLTFERQKQVDKTTEDWILFLDDDDWWPKESLEEILPMLDEDIDAISPSPIQVIDGKYYDKHWYENKFFTKWFRNKDINYKGWWPRDNILSGDKELYWKKNKRTKRLYGKYFHLSGIKQSTFRNEAWSKGHYEEPIKNRSKYPKWCKPHIEQIWTYLK